MNKYDIILVGSGLHNAVFARLATNIGLKCLVIEKRDHIGGNCYDKVVDGINVHMYGPHIFHTNYDDVWKFLSMYTTFNNYINQPIANWMGEIYNLPFNMNTFHQMWNWVITPEHAKLMIENTKYKPNHEPKNLEEQALSLVGETIYTKLIKGYTEKQWGKDCKDLPADIIKRLPLRFTYNNNYFNDRYQGIPDKGYSDLFNNLFDGCDIMLNTDYFDIDLTEYKNPDCVIVYSGEIDRYFNYIYGKLEYRSLRFETEKIDVQNYQGNAVVNYTDRKTPYTRIVEHKHFDVWNENAQNLNHTIITKEYPVKYDSEITTDPYYPICNEENLSRYEKYKKWGESLPGVIFGGRLAEYKYYDMDKVAKSAMINFDKFINKHVKNICKKEM